MNTNGNTYTVIYSTVLVVLVAAILAFAAMSLKPRQDANVKVETISKILTAAGLYDADAAAKGGNDYVLSTYENNIVSAHILNWKGEVVDSMATSGKDLTIFGDLKSQADIMKQMAEAKDASQAEAVKENLRLPVYIFNIEGRKIRIVPCYGAGLWGPIWGYLAFEEDMNTVHGAVFDHKGETPGLGAEIASVKFYSQFAGKTIFEGNELASIEVCKGGAAADDANGVDAISGGTITSQALQKTMHTWLEMYVPYFKANSAKTIPAMELVPAMNINE